ncbi:GNAT family N-acetyltransferase [Robiginitalea sp. IMCC43444]|uniref:GNAT family N-acetyltransferase n=1 Tax=Robiginitalea sp. IMCC43444 TaxID=3459121 RepID=UPI004041EAD2
MPAIEAIRVREPMQIEVVAALAGQIWKRHYTPIIGPDQVGYMLQKYQSAEAIKDQINEGMRYYLLKTAHQTAGYLAFSIEEKHLFLSKIYLKQEFRGMGYGSSAMDFVKQCALRENCKEIRLTVNKNNTCAIEAYEGMGFRNVKAVVQDIGQGFVMDDYLMVLTLN